MLLLYRHREARRSPQRRVKNMNALNTVFGRTNENGDVVVFDESGEVCTRLDANVYPVGSQLSARYEHAEGIVISAADATKLGIALDD